MKKIWLFILGLCTIFFAGNFTQANDYEYTDLNITANVWIDGTIDVDENFTANFFVDKHGIIRTIPLNYTVGGHDFHIDISNINVAGKTFTTSKNGGDVEIKIGDADRTIIGTQSYPISYSAYGLIRNFSGMGYAELYWNLVGYDFDTNINEFRAEIILPKIYTGFTSDDFLITTDGTTTSVEDFQGYIDRSPGNKITIIYDNKLPANQGITLSIKFPNDYFEFDHDKQSKLIGHVKDGWRGKILETLFMHFEVIFVATILLFFLIAYSIIGSKNKIGKKSGALKGKFAKQFPVIVQYEPPKGLNSAEVGLLLHRRAIAKDMISLIYKWAAEKIINISVEKSKGFIFSKDVIILTKNKDIPEESPEYEKSFFKKLIHDKINKIEKNTNMYKDLHLSKLEKYGENEGWFTINKYSESLPLLFVIGLILLILFTGVIGVGIFILVGFALGSQRLKETEEGAKLISHILGYREFLAACDENKLRLFLQQDPLYFDKILPYAVVFGLETELLKKIEPIMKEMNLGSPLYGGDISSMYIISNILSSSASHSVPPSSSYSSSSGFSGGSSFGGGFSSGGGGGGGGGRSW